MKLKQLIFIAATIGLSSHAFAMEIYKGKVISEKVWSNDGSKAALGKSKKPRFKHESGNLHEQIMSSISSDASAVNEPITLNNMHAVYVYNGTDETKQYLVMESICSQTSDNFNRCIFYHKQIELQPQGYIEETKVPVLEMTYTKPGKYRVTVTTDVYDGGFPHVSEGRATVFVS